MSQTRIPRFGLYAPFAAALVLLAIYAAIWLRTASAVEAEIDAWAAEERAAGAEVSYGEVKARGFPAFLRISLEAPSYAEGPGPRALSWSAERIAFHASPFDANHVVADVEGPLVVSFLDDPGVAARAPRRVVLEIETDATRGSLRKTAAGRNFAVEMTNGKARRTDAHAIGGDITFEKLLVQTSDASDEETDTPLLLAAVSGAGVTVRLDSPFFEGAPLTLWAFEAVGALSPAPRSGEGAFQRWMDEGGEALIDRFQVTSGEARLAASGRLAMDAAGFPSGRMNVRLQNADDLVDVFVAGGALPAEMSETVRAAFQVFAATSAEAGVVKVDLAVKNGEVKLGPLVIAKHPPLTF
ncbi:MAG: DUF2125 domain-containing protein [Pseudomonadota bacterium]